MKFLDHIGLLRAAYLPNQFVRIMRLTIIIITMALMQVSAAGLAQKVSLSFRNVPLEQVLIAVKQQTAYNFVYTEDVIAKAKRVSINIKNADLKDVLILCFENQPLNFTIEQNTIMIKEKTPSFLDRVVSAFASIDVRGIVLDEAGNPLVGATVKVKDANKSTKTNEKGEFYLQDVDETAVLVISYLGYVSREVNVASNMGSLTMVLADSKLEEVEINAGYYTVKDRERTGSISRVTAETIGKQPVNNPLQALQGRIPGVDIVQTTGVPGGGFNVRIRGTNSIQNGNEPLYIVNGVQVASTLLSSNAISGFITVAPNPLSSINPLDIESIEVLKDADATAIYGSRGANGVVLISTKKGKPGKASIGFNIYQGLGKVGHMMDLLNTSEYIEMRKEAYANDNATPVASAYDINGVWDQTRYTDWQKELIGGTANVSNAQLSVSGGSENTTFLLSGNYYRETTVFPGDKSYQKKTSLLNISHISTDHRFKANASASYNIENNKLPPQDLTSFVFLPPNAPALFAANGGINWENGTFGNPIVALYRDYKADVGTVTLNANMSYLIIPGLELSTRIGYTKMQRDEIRTNPLSAQYQTGLLTANNRTAFYANNWIGTLNLEPQLSWTYKVGPGKLNLLIGTTIQESKKHTQTIQGTGYVNDGLLENIAAAATLTSNINETKTSSYRYLSIYGRVNYNLYDTFFLNITGRRDGSSRFGPDNIYANFGSVGAGWIFSNHKIIANKIPFLSFGKLRASYGVSGNDQIGDYQFLDLWIPGIVYQGSPTLIPTKLFNAGYAWENTKKAEIALELGFLNDKIHLTTAYFKNRSSNQLVNSPLPSNVGFGSILQNLPAIVQNTGLELDFLVKVIDKKSLKWSLNVNGSIPRNKLVAFPNIEKTSYSTTHMVGKPINGLTKILQSTGVNPTTGTYTFCDYDGTGSITTPGDLNVIKTLSPKYIGGLQNTINYKMIELDFLFQFVNQLGKSILPSTAPGGASNQPIYVLKRWQKANDITNVQKYTVTSATLPYSNNYAWGELGLENTSFIRLKNISLAYNVPKTTLNHIRFQNLKVYLQAQNLFTVTNYSGLDPENQSFKLPPLRMITAGLRGTF